jgi:hypothetical protein
MSQAHPTICQLANQYTLPDLLTWISVLQPCAANVRVLLVYNKLHILTVLLYLIGHLNARETGADS